VRRSGHNDRSAAAGARHQAEPEAEADPRTVWRLRDQHVKEAGRVVQQMQNALTEMNVQLHSTISDLSGAG
jgi:hypothetical protein